MRTQQGPRSSTSLPSLVALLRPQLTGHTFVFLKVYFFYKMHKISCVGNIFFN